MTETIAAIYRFRVPAGQADARARGIAVEQSVEMPVEAIADPFVLSDIVGRVESVVDLGEGEFEARIHYAADSAGCDAGQLINILFGNSSLQHDVALHDVDLPPDLLAAFGGPAIGVAGWRERLNAPDRLLTLSNLKPQGLSSAELAKLAGLLAASGVDLIKDDHGLADQRYSPFADRVPRIADAVRDASSHTNQPTRYLPHVTGNLDQLRTGVEIARRNGLDGALVMPMVTGLSSFHTLRRENPDFAFMAHPAMAGAARITPALLIGRIFRLFGTDAVVFPGHGGRFGASPVECIRLVDFACRPWAGLAPTLPVPAGGMTIERIRELSEFYGRDACLFLGGSLLAAGDRLTEEAARFVKIVHALKAQRPTNQA